MREKETDPEAPGQESHRIESSSSSSEADAEIARHWSRDVVPKTKGAGAPVATTTKLKNPLSGLTREQLFKEIEQFAREKDMEEILPELKKGALISQDPKMFEEIPDLTEEDKELLRREKTHRWHQPFMMYFMTSMSFAPTV
jgi:hypothetical protein